MLNKKVLAAAVVGTLFAGSAAAANLSAPGGAVPAYFAQEIIATPAAPRTLTTSASSATELNWNINYNFSGNEVRYARVECSDNLRFGANTAVTKSGVNPAGTIGSINGLGTNALTFSVTSPATGIQILEADVFTVTGDHAITGTSQNVNCSVGLYDQPSQAQAGGSAGLIQNTSFNGAYLAFAPSYELIATSTTHVANVEAVPSFSDFVAQNLDTTATIQVGRTGASSIAYRLRDPDGTAGAQTATFGINGNPVTLANLLAPTTSISVAGDYSLLASTGTTPYDAAAQGRTSLGSFAPSALSATNAVYPVGNAGFTAQAQVLTRRAGVLIQPSEYVATLNAVAAAPADYAVSNISNVKFGEIVRNGTELQAPLVQVPNGWLARVALTNTGSVARTYTISVLTETGATFAVDSSKLTGTIPANGTQVVQLNDTDFADGSGRRATLVVSVAGPTGQIQGLYQVVNPNTGLVTNHVLVRPGTN